MMRGSFRTTGLASDLIGPDPVLAISLSKFQTKNWPVVVVVFDGSTLEEFMLRFQFKAN